MREENRFQLYKKETMISVSSLFSIDSSTGYDDFKKVSFAKLEVFEIPMILGDHPDADGAPVTLDWSHQSSFSMDIEIFEHFREKRRAGNELRIPRSSRERYLRSVGYSERDLDLAEREVEQTRAERAESKGDDDVIDIRDWAQENDWSDKTDQLDAIDTYETDYRRYGAFNGRNDEMIGHVKRKKDPKRNRTVRPARSYQSTPRIQSTERSRELRPFERSELHKWEHVRSSPRSAYMETYSAYKLSDESSCHRPTETFRPRMNRSRATAA